MHSKYAEQQMQLFSYSADAGRIAVCVGIGVGQGSLNQIAEALYRGSITLDGSSVAEIVQAAHYLQMPAILEACVSYFCKHVAELGSKVCPQRRTGI